jgi:obg-like ATPase 1
MVKYPVTARPLRLNLKQSFHCCRVLPKKLNEVPASTPIRLGRSSNNLKGGIVGLANVGKSTFFQAITKSSLGNPANYPFATIDPEEARVIVPSPRFEKLADLYQPQKKTPANLTVFDIAGLTRGASKGEGLGNAFLSHIRSVDGLFQVVRAFDDEEIVHIEKTVDPVRDLEIILDELLLKDMEFVTKHIEVLQRSLKSLAPGRAKKTKDELHITEKVLECLERGKRVANGKWTSDDVKVINSMALLTAKPSVYLANVSEEDYIVGLEENARLREITEWIETYSAGDTLIPISVNFESRLAKLSESEQHSELDALEVSSAIPSAIIELRKSLHLISFFTYGKDEVREWTIRQGVLAPEAAGVIHADLEKTFIQAQIVKYEDAIAANGDDSKIRASAKISFKGKDYEMQDGDLAYFRVGIRRDEIFN